MLIGLDASRAFIPEVTGTELYSRAVIQALAAQGPQHKFRLYTRGEGAAFFSATNCEVRALAFPRLWTHTRLAWEMAFHPPEALFVPAHVLPLVHPRSSFVTVHDLGYLYFPSAHRPLDRLYLNLSTRWNVRAARRVFADSEATRRDLESKCGAPPEKITVAYPGVDPSMRTVAAKEVDAIRKRYSLSGPFLLAVGTIQPRKNYLRLLQALARMDVKPLLVIAGRAGSNSALIERALKSPPAGARVRWLGYVPRQDLPALYCAATASIFPSLYEGFGFPVLEAMACGVPVACSNSSSLPEVGGDAALYFDPSKVDQMGEVVGRLIQDGTTRTTLIQKGLENVRRFSWDRCAATILSGMERD